MAIGGTLQRTLQVVITANARGLAAGMGNAGRSVDTFSAKLRRGIGRAAPYAAIGLAAVAYQARQGVQGVMDDEKALNNLESSLKATGNAANITGRGFFQYANELQRATGVGADQITQGAAILATFRNIREGVGASNKVFSRATELALDLSKKMGTDLSSANVMLGKALDNPIKGVAALQRVGVGLTDQQKEQVKAFQESGNILGAQKIILAALEGQVGGTAKAYGTTTAGQVDRATRAFEELQKALAVALLPVVQFFANGLGRVSEFMQENEGVTKALIIAFTALAGAIVAARAALAIGGALAAISSPITAVILAVGALAVGFVALWTRSEEFREKATAAFQSVKAAVLPAIESIVQTVRVLWPTIQRVIVPVVTSIVDQIKAGFAIVSGVVQTVAALFRGDFRDAIEGVKTIVRGVFSSLGAIIRGLIGAAVGAAVELAKAIAGAILRVPEFMLGLASSIVSGLGSALTSAVGWVGQRFLEIGRAIVEGIKNGISNAWGAFRTWLLDKLGSPLQWAKDLLGIGSPSRVFANQVGAPMAQGIGVGFAREMDKQKPKFAAGVVAAVRAARGNLASLASSFGSMAAQAVGARYVDPVTGKTPAQLEKEHNDVLAARREADLRAAVTNAEDEEASAAAQVELDDYLTERHIAAVQAQAAATAASAEAGVNNLVAEYNRGGLAAEDFRARLNGLLGGATGAELGAAFADSFSAAMNTLLAQMQSIWQQAGLRGITGTPGGTLVSPTQPWSDMLANVRKSLTAQWTKAHPKGDVNSAAAQKWIEGKLAAWRQKNAARYGMARGGIVDEATAAVIGEAGPEAVVPLASTSGRRALAAALRDAGAGGAQARNVTVNVTFEGVLDAREAARRIQPEINRIVSLV